MATSTRSLLAGELARRCVAGLPLALLALALLAAPAAAQKRGRIAGTVLDEASSEPVRDAKVTLRGRPAPVATDSAGRYELTDVPPGTLVMQVKAIGFASASRIVEVTPGATTTVDLTLAKAQELAEMTVTTQAPAVSHRFDEFEQRRKNGRGQYFTREEIEKTNAATLNDLLQRLRGVQQECTGGHCFLRMSRSPVGCPPEYIVDGRPQNDFGPNTPIRDIQGVEVYAGSSETPAEFVGQGGCGTIVIWTKSSP